MKTAIDCLDDAVKAFKNKYDGLDVEIHQINNSGNAQAINSSHYLRLVSQREIIGNAHQYVKRLFDDATKYEQTTPGPRIVLEDIILYVQKQKDNLTDTVSTLIKQGQDSSTHYKIRVAEMTIYRELFNYIRSLYDKTVQQN